MRRALPAALICLLATVPALAQRGGHAGGGRGGGVHVGGMRGGGVTHTGGGFAHRPGFGGARGGFGHRPFFRSGFRFNRFPLFYPAFYGGLGYYDPYWSTPYPDTYSGYTPDYNYQSDQAPPVIVNQEFQPAPAPQPMLREYGFTTPAPAPVERKYAEPLYLIAFHDGVIRAVLAYWVEGESLRYVTMDHEQKQASLASIDRALSERLNSERNVTFQLPR